MSLSNSKVIVTTETPGEDCDFIDSIPVTVFTAVSIRLVIEESIISGLAPSSVVVTESTGNSIIGKRSTPIFWYPM